MLEIQRTSPGGLHLPHADRSAPVSPHGCGAAALALEQPLLLGSPRRSAPEQVAEPLAPSEPSRLERLGLMTAGIAHDFNNVLSVIMVCASEIAAAAGDGEQHERAREIADAAERGAELSRRLLTEESLPEPEATPVEIEVAIIDALPLVKRTLGDGIEVALSSEGHLPHVLLAPGELQRMLINLAANARDAMPEGGGVAVHTSEVTVGPGDPSLGTGWHLRISFTDTGAGMSAEVARCAAQPYFTTKQGTGSGLGLATVRGLVRARGGELRLSSAAGAGTTVAIDLPAVTAAGEPLSLPAAAPST